MARHLRWAIVLIAAPLLCFVVLAPLVLYKHQAPLAPSVETTSSRHLLTTTVGPTVDAMPRPKVDVVSDGMRLGIKAPQSACTCQGTENSDKCDCVNCDAKEERALCAQLLGSCECKRDEESMLCECSGYCKNTDARIAACRKEWGCAWNGVSCDVQEFDAYLVMHGEEEEEIVRNVDTPEDDAGNDNNSVKLKVKTINV